MELGNFSRGQIAAFIGFVILIFSIPLGMTLVKQSQIFKSGASGPTARSSLSTQTDTTLQEVPATSPIGELEKYLSTASATPSITPTPTPASSGTSTTAVSFGQTLNFKISIEGKPQASQAAKMFVGIASGATSSAQPKFLLSFSVDVPDSGEYNGLSLAGLDTSSIYTAYLKGPSQIDNAATFSIGPAATNLNGGQALTLLSGDLNEDNVVNSADYSIIKGLLGKRAGDASFNLGADFNADGVINSLDVAYILKNFGKTGISGPWYSPVPAASPSATPAGGIGSPSTGGYWMWVP